jgi:hypothetical protein
MKDLPKFSSAIVHSQFTESKAFAKSMFIITPGMLLYLV